MTEQINKALYNLQIRNEVLTTRCAQWVECAQEICRILNLENSEQVESPHVALAKIKQGIRWIREEQHK